MNEKKTQRNKYKPSEYSNSFIQNNENMQTTRQKHKDKSRYVTEITNKCWNIKIHYSSGIHATFETFYIEYQISS